MWFACRSVFAIFENKWVFHHFAWNWTKHAKKTSKLPIIIQRETYSVISDAIWSKESCKKKKNSSPCLFVCWIDRFRLLRLVVTGFLCKLKTNNDHSALTIIYIKPHYVELIRNTKLPADLTSKHCNDLFLLVSKHYICVRKLYK